MLLLQLHGGDLGIELWSPVKGRRVGFGRDRDISLMQRVSSLIDSVLYSLLSGVDECPVPLKAAAKSSTQRILRQFSGLSLYV